MTDEAPPDTGTSCTEVFFDWVNTHVKWITIGVAVLTVVAVPLAVSRSQDDPNFDRSGEIYDTRSRTGAERQHLLDLTGVAPGEYDPHSRQTALQGAEKTALQGAEKTALQGAEKTAR